MSEVNDSGQKKTRQKPPPPLDLLPFSVLIVIWLVALAHYPRLPDLFPLQFKLGGAPSNWINKGPQYFLLPAVGALSYLALNLVGRVALRRPMPWGRPFRGRAAVQVNRLLVRYLFLMKSAVLVFLLNVQFRSIQIAYGTREALGWDTYLAGGALFGYAIGGSVLLYVGARRLQRWQDRVGDGA